MVKIYTADTLFEAKEIEENLAEKDIGCKIEVSSYLTMPNAVPKEIYEILVLEKEAGKAVELLEGRKISKNYTEPHRRRVARICAIFMLVIFVLILAYSVMETF